MHFVELLKFRFAHAKKEILFFFILSVLLLIAQELFVRNLFASAGPYEFLFLSNFVNKAWENCIFNIVMMWAGVLLILLSTNTQFKRSFWFNSIFLILIISPFFLSILNLLVIYPLINNLSLGYSGIAAIFLGYGFIAISLFAYTFLNVNNLPKREIYLIFAVFGIVVLFPIAIFTLFADPIELSLIQRYGVIDGIFQTFIQTKTNIFIHVVGYVIGLLVPIISTLIFRLNSLTDQFSMSDFPK
jgi:hypothetical protein